MSHTDPMLAGWVVYGNGGTPPPLNPEIRAGLEAWSGWQEKTSSDEEAERGEGRSVA